MGKQTAIGSGQATRKPLPRVAVVGCGAAAREYCLPLLTKFPDCRRSVVAVDTNAMQAAAVASEFDIHNHCSDYRSLPFEVDAAIVTTPHYLHAEQSIHFLRQGIPVFVEKPLGMSSVEVEQMLAAAKAGCATLMVNNCRRLFPAYCGVHELLGSGKFGDVLRVTVSDGSPFEWNSVSAFYLRNAQQAHGVFLDRGSHTVDIVGWWLAGRPQVVASRFDSRGGAEALMRVEMKFGRTDVELVFSRLYKLENCYSIDCEKAHIRGRLFQSTKFEIVRNGHVESIQAGQPALYHEYAWQLLENFVEVVQGIATPRFTAADVAPSIDLIDEAYQLATPFDSPWYEGDPNLALIRNLVTEHNP